MAATELLARDFKFEINTGTSGSPTWTEIKGINTWELKEAPKEADATDFNDNGWGSAIVVANKITISLKGNFNATGATRDAGQAAVEAAARTFGATGVKMFRIYSRSSASFTDAATTGGSIAFSAAVKMGGTGGGSEALLPWSCELLVDGQPTYAGYFA